MGPRSVTSVLAASLLVAGMAACSGDDEGGQAAGSTTATTEASTSTTDATTSSSATSTTVGPGDCGPPVAVPPAGATDVSRRQVDADGDGEDDDAYAFLDGGVPTVAVRLADGTTAGEATGDPAGTPLQVIGGADIGGGGDTVFARVGSGASVDLVGLFELDGCALTRVTLTGGEPLALAVGGTVTHADGIRCTGDDAGGLTVLTATSVDGETFTTDDRTYRLVGSELVEVGSATATLTRPANDDDIQDHYGLDCPGVG